MTPPNLSARKVATQPPNSLRLDQRTLEALLDRLDEQETRASGKAASRHYTRCAFRQRTVPVTLLHPGGSRTTLVLASRNISSAGLSLLHSSYVHTGTTCHAVLPRTSQDSCRIGGKVIRCRQVAGVVHEVGIEFDTRVSVRDFVRADALTEFFSFENVDPAELKGTLLHCESSAIDQQLLRHFLKETALRIRVAPSIEQAATMCGEGVDVILSGSEMPDGDAADLIQRLRQSSTSCRILLASSDSSPRMRDRLLQRAPDGFLAKPLTQERLFRALAELLLLESPTHQAALPPSEALTEVVESYIVELQQSARRLTTCLNSNDVEACAKICRELRGTAPSLGFVALAELAQRAELAVAAVGSLTKAAGQVQDLINGCARASR